MLYLLFLLLPACDVVEVRRHQVEKKLRNVGLTEHQVRLQNHSIHYWKGGEKTQDPLLIIHGFGGDGVWTWQPNLIQLAAKRPILLPDLLWFGKSKSTGAPTLHSQVAALKLLLEQQNWEKIDVLGVSYGGFVALRLLQVIPQKIDQVIIVNSPGKHISQADITAINHRFQVQNLHELFVPNQPEEIQRLIDLCFYKDHPKLPLWILKAIFQRDYSRYKNVRRAMLQELIDNRQVYETGEIIWPRSLILWGEHDPVFPVHHSHKLAAELQGELTIIPNTAHAPNLEKPERFNQLVNDFLGNVKLSTKDKPRAQE